VAPFFPDTVCRNDFFVGTVLAVARINDRIVIYYLVTSCIWHTCKAKPQLAYTQLFIVVIVRCSEEQLVPPENCDLALHSFCTILTFSHDLTIFVVERNFCSALATFVSFEAAWT